MLYDESLKQIDIAVSNLGKGKDAYDIANNAILKAHNIIAELSVSLNLEAGGEIANKLHSLYDYFSSKLMEANVKKDTQPLQEIRPLIAELRESWDKIVDSSDTPAEQSSAVDISG